MTTYNILCTGNPKKKTVAYALGCDHVSLSSGWDFTELVTMERFRTNIINYNVFVNSSYIGLGVQLALMNIAYQAWMQKNIRGHIITIGTTLEYSSDESQYAIDKRSLKQRSLELSDQTGITGVKSTYLILGGIAAVSAGTAMKQFGSAVSSSTKSKPIASATGGAMPSSSVSSKASGSSYQYGGSSYATQSVRLMVDLTGSITATQTGYSINKSLETTLRVTGR